MTGYGKQDGTFAGKRLHVEVKSLNSKSFDLSTRIAPLYREKEMEIRKMLSNRLVRGKVDFALWVEKDTAAPLTPINATAAAFYVDQLRQVSREVGIELDPQRAWEVLLRLPGITEQAEQEELSDEEWDEVKGLIEKAVEALEAFRKQEGEALCKKFEEKLTNIGSLLASIEPYEKGRTAKIRERLLERLSELKGVDYDKNRLEQELIYYIEKLDISEEKQRLSNHLEYFRKTMVGPAGQGKTLGFIAQEMGREINTTGSKSNLAEMQNIVVKMKDELEQIKEQVLNVL